MSLFQGPNISWAEREGEVAQPLVFTLAQNLAVSWEVALRPSPHPAPLSAHERRHVLFNKKIPCIVFCVSQLPLVFLWVTVLRFWELMTAPKAVKLSWGQLKKEAVSICMGFLLHFNFALNTFPFRKDELSNALQWQRHLQNKHLLTKKIFQHPRHNVTHRRRCG